MFGRAESDFMIGPICFTTAHSHCHFNVYFLKTNFKTTGPYTFYISEARMSTFLCEFTDSFSHNSIINSNLPHIKLLYHILTTACQSKIYIVSTLGTISFYQPTLSCHSLDSLHQLPSKAKRRTRKRSSIPTRRKVLRIANTRRTMYLIITDYEDPLKSSTRQWKHKPSRSTNRRIVTQDILPITRSTALAGATTKKLWFTSFQYDQT